MSQSTATLQQPYTQSLEITIVRIIDARPEKVFEAWLYPDHLAGWWGPRDGRRDWTTPDAQTDPKQGGTYRICIRLPQGEDYWAGGVYREIEKPRRLVFTHAWEKGGGEPAHERVVTVDFSEADGGKTRIAFRITGFPSIASRDSEIEGWNECLDRLVQYVADGQQSSQDEAEIRALVAAWSRALEAKDLDGLMAGYAPDVLLFDCKPPYQTKGVQGYLAHWEACLPYFPAKMQSEHRDLSITVDGDVAFVHGLHHVTPIGEESRWGQTWLRVTVCYRRIEGNWRVVHEHVSVPFDPITEKVSYITDQDVSGTPC